MSEFGDVERADLDLRGSMSPEALAAWLSQRVGKLTASRMREATAKIKSGAYAASRANLMRELLAERYTGYTMDHYVSTEMRWGLQQEQAAKNAYQVATGRLIFPCGFFDHPTITDFGATPDGLVGDDGLIEIKCPKTSTFVDWLMLGDIPEDHMPQMATQLACTGRKWVDFVAFDPRIKTRSQIIIRRFRPVPSWVAMIEDEARKFIADLEKAWDILIHSPLPEVE